MNNQSGDVTRGLAGIKRIIGEYQEQLYTYKFYNVEEMNRFLQKRKLPELTRYKTDDMNSPVTVKEIEFAINYTKKNLQAQIVSLEHFTKCLKTINTHSSQSIPEIRKGGKIS